jgi:hypothetical protein
LLRVVALRKAILAGAAGALAWEALLRTLLIAGVPTYDVVRELGTLVFPSGPMLEWWPAGFAAHALVGIAWAMFYAYFFWARFRWPPAMQGLAFAALPAALAALVIHPQLQLMHLHQDVARIGLHSVFAGWDRLKVGGLLLGHALFGLTVGTLYTHPVGYPANRPIARPRPPRRSSKPSGRRATNSGFIFATGIECSYPTIEQGTWRRDQMDSTRHYLDWAQDFELAR